MVIKEIRFYSAWHHKVYDIVAWLRETFNEQGGEWKILDNQHLHKYELVITPNSEEVAMMIRLKYGCEI